ncbi:MAG: oligosaccharide flippase family protein [Novosphingobium sp.]
MNLGRTQRWPARSVDGRALASRLGAFLARDTNVVVASFVATNLLRMVSSVVLTRLLMPEAFGIAGVIASIQFTAVMVSDLGFQAFVVRHLDGDKPRFQDTIWTISLIRGVALTLILMGLAGPLAHVFSKPELEAVIALSSLAFVIDGLTSLSLMTALRQRLILRLSLLELLVMVVQIAATIILAWYWKSFWVLQIATLLSSALKAVLSYTIFPNARRRLAWDSKYARELWSFARFITGSSIIFLLLSQCDKLILARLMSVDAFGLYILAGNLAAAPIAFASAYSGRVLYPAYAQMWRDGGSDLRRDFYAKRWLPSMVYNFAAGGLIGSATLVVAVLYDPRYAQAAIYVEVLAIGAMLALASAAANETLMAIGRVRSTFEANIARLAWMLVAGPLGYMLHGEIGLVLAVALLEVPGLLIKWVRMHGAGLLDLRQEMLFLAVGGAGFAVGALGSDVLEPFVR